MELLLCCLKGMMIQRYRPICLLNVPLNCFNKILKSFVNELPCFLDVYWSRGFVSSFQRLDIAQIYYSSSAPFIYVDG